MATDRERFEQWAKSRPDLPIQEHEFSRYDCERTIAWESWQAAQASQWIRVEDGLPAKGIRVIAFREPKPLDGSVPSEETRLSCVAVGEISEDGVSFSRGMSPWFGVTHWQPLPEPPKETR